MKKTYDIVVLKEGFLSWEARHIMGGSRGHMFTGYGLTKHGAIRDLKRAIKKWENTNSVYSTKTITIKL